MAINKNFVIKNGVQVATDLIVGDSDTKKVGIGTTIAGYTLHVGATNVGGRGGIGATDAVITGVGTIKDLLVSGASGFSSDVSVSGIVSAQSFGIGTTEIIDRGMRLSGIASLDAVTTATIEEAIRVGPNSFSDLKVSGISTFVGIATFATGLDVVSGVSTFGAPLRIGFAGTTDHAGVALGATVGFGTSAFFQDGAAIYMGDDSDLKIFHDSSNSFIQDLGTGNLYVDSNSLQIRNATGTETQAVFTENGSVDLYFDDSKKVETTSGGLKVTGITTLTNRLHVEAGISTFDADVRFGIGATVGFGTSAFFRDNAAIFMGNDEDLKIFTDQDGDVRFQQQNAGKIIISSTGAGDAIKLQARHDEESIIARVDGAVEQYYDNSKKTETTSGGFKVTGITTFSDRINVVSGVSTFQDNAFLKFGSQGDLSINHDGTNSFISNSTGQLDIVSDDLDIRSATGDEHYFSAQVGGAASIFYDNINVFQTTPQGINVSGVTTSNRLNISGVSTFTSIGSNLIPDTDGSRNIGAAGSEWQDLHIDGTANIDTLAADTAAIADLTNDRVVIVGTSGELEDSGNLTFDGTTLAVTGKETVSVDITVGSGVTIQNHGGVSIAGITTIGGDLSISDKIIHGSDTNTAIRFPAADNVSVETAGTERLLFMDDGNIKINGDQSGNNRAVVYNNASGFALYASSHASVDRDFLFYSNITGGSQVVKIASDGIHVGTQSTIAVNGNAAFAGIVTIGGDLNVVGDIVYDEITGRNLNITGLSTFADDVLFKGATSGRDITFDQSNNSLFFADDTRLKFGNTSASPDLIIQHSSGKNFIEGSSTGAVLNIRAKLNEDQIKLTPDGPVELFYDNVKIFQTTGVGITVGLSSIQHNGNAAFAGIVTANGGVVVGSSATIAANGNITAGIVTAVQFQGGGVGVGIGSTTDNPFSGEKVGYGFTFIKFAGPGVSTVYADTRAGYTGFATVFIEGGGSSVGAAGTWQNDQVGISTAKSVGVNTSTINDPDLQGTPHVGAAGSFQGLYIGNGMIVNDNQLNGDHYIGTAFGGMMAGPVTINGVLTVDGSYVVV